MSIFDSIFRGLKNKHQDEPITLPKALIFVKRLDAISQNIEYALRKIVHSDCVSTPEEFAQKMGEQNYALAIFIIPMLNETVLQNMINLSKNKNAKTIIVWRGFLMDRAFALGTDYFLVSDDYAEFDYTGTGILKGTDWVPVDNLKKLSEYVLSPAHVKLNQNERNMIAEKTEFYNGVHDIFTMRANETASTKQELEFIIAILKKDCKKILDAGCGNGRITEPLALDGFNMTGIDINEQLLEDAIKKRKSNENPQYVKSSIIKTLFSAKTFDAVLMMWHVICEVKSYQKETLQEARRILNNEGKGGILILDFPNINQNALISDEGIYTSNHGLYKYIGLVPQLKQFVALLEACGFKILTYKRLQWGTDKFVIVAKKI